MKGGAGELEGGGGMVWREDAGAQGGEFERFFYDYALVRWRDKLLRGAFDGFGGS